MSVTARIPYAADYQQAQMDALETLANSKDVYGAPYDFSVDWKTELARLRACLSNTTYVVPNLNVSGPWPLQGLSTVLGTDPGFSSYPHTVVDGTTGAPSDAYFYFAASSEDAAAETVVMGLQGQLQSIDQADIDERNATGSYRSDPSSMTCKVLIGGTTDVRFRGRLAFWVYNSDDYTATPSGTMASTDFPGASWYGVGGGVPARVESEFDTTVSPGTYTFELAVTDPWHVYGLNQYLGSVISCRIDHTISDAAVATPGIHSTLPVWRIDCALPNGSSGFPFGIYEWSPRLTPGGDFIGKWFMVSTGTGDSGIVLTAADIAGLWVGKTSMIRGIGNYYAYMPWNPLLSSPPGDKGKPYFSAAVDPNIAPHETATAPAPGSLFTWSGTTAVLAGRYLIGGQLYFLATTGGTTDEDEPEWPTEAGQSITERDVTWLAIGNFLTARSRFYSLPKWPIYKYGEARSAYLPSSLPYWSQFNTGYNPYWFIWRVRINRILGKYADDATMDGISPVSVTIGCITSGSFVSFAEFDVAPEVAMQSGQWLEGPPMKSMGRAVMWPIFTKDSLVYKADEYVDVQADIIDYPTVSHAVDFPIMASHYNDAETILNQL